MLNRVRLRLLQSPCTSLRPTRQNTDRYRQAGGHVEISWTVTADGRLSLRWIESGGPSATPPTHRGFGNAHYGKYDWSTRGVRCVLIGATKASLRNRFAACIGRAATVLRIGRIIHFRRTARTDPSQ